MTKDEALDLALAALEHMLEDAKQERLTVEYWNECVDAITAIKQARSAPVQEPVAYIRVSKTGHVMVCAKTGDFFSLPDGKLLYTTPPAAQPAYIDSTPQLSVGDSSFESWFSGYNPAGKGDKQRARDAYAAGMGDPLVAATVQEPVAWMHTMIDDVVVGHRPADLNVHPDRWMPLYKDPTPCQTCEALARTVMMDQTAHDTTPRAANRPWFGLTDEEIIKAIENIAGRKNIARAIEAKLRSKNNG